MPIRLTVENNNDLTATYTVSGLNGTTLTAVDIYSFQLTRFAALPVLSHLGTITYPATTLIVSYAAKGLYQGLGVDNTGLFTNAAAVQVTNGDSLATRCGEAVAAQIEALALVDDLAPVVAPLHVYRQWNDDLSNVQFPACIVDVNDQVETDTSAVSTADDIGYPAELLILDAEPLTDHRRLKLYERWRENIARAFRRQRLFGVSESKINLVEFGNIGDHVGQAYDKLVSKLTIRCICREGRGIGA